jgi:hypothetical protein
MIDKDEEKRQSNYLTGGAGNVIPVAPPSPPRNTSGFGVESPKTSGSGYETPVKPPPNQKLFGSFGPTVYPGSVVAQGDPIVNFWNSRQRAPQPPSGAQTITAGAGANALLGAGRETQKTSGFGYETPKTSGFGVEAPKTSGFGVETLKNPDAANRPDPGFNKMSMQTIGRQVIKDQDGGYTELDITGMRPDNQQQRIQGGGESQLDLAKFQLEQSKFTKDVLGQMSQEEMARLELTASAINNMIPESLDGSSNARGEALRMAVPLSKGGADPLTAAALGAQAAQELEAWAKMQADALAQVGAEKAQVAIANKRAEIQRNMQRLMQQNQSLYQQPQTPNQQDQFGF